MAIVYLFQFSLKNHPSFTYTSNMISPLVFQMLYTGAYPILSQKTQKTPVSRTEAFYKNNIKAHAQPTSSMHK